jgi:hypothetical protein
MAAYLSRIKEQRFAGKPLGRCDLTLAEVRERGKALRIYGALVLLLFVTIAPGVGMLDGSIRQWLSRGSLGQICQSR